MTLDIDAIDEQSKHTRRHATGDEHIRRCPSLLSARNAILQQPAAQEHETAHDGNLHHTVAIVLNVNENLAHHEAYEYMGYTGQSAQDALGIESQREAIGTLVIHVVFAQHGKVNLAKDVIAIEVIAVTQAEYQSIYNEDEDYHSRDKLLLYKHSNERAKEVNKCQTLEHTQDAQVVKAHIKE